MGLYAAWNIIKGKRVHDPYLVNIEREYLEEKKYKMHVRVFISRFRSPFVCPSCKGTRLREEANHVLVNDFNITQLTEMTIEDLNAFFQKLQLSPLQT